MSSLVDLLEALVQRVTALEQRISAQTWRGKVKQVDPQKGTARIIIGQDEDGKDVLSPWLPYAQTAGDLKFHNPPSVGQQMELQASNGDIRQSTLRPLHWWNEQQSPDDQGDRHTATIGNVRAHIKNDNVKITVGRANLEMTDGFVKTTIGASTIRALPNGINLTVGGSEIVIVNGAINIKSPLVLVEGSQLFHNIKNVGDTHTNAGLLVD